MTGSAMSAKLMTLVRLTLLELWRQRLAFAPIGVAVVMAIAVVSTGGGASGSLTVNGAPVALGQVRTLAGFSYGTLGFIGTLLGFLAGAGLLSSEIERGTVFLLATKPLPRWLLVLGKALGAFVFLLVSFFVWGLLLILGASVHLHTPELAPLFVGTLVAALVPFLFAAVALFYSAFLPTMAAVAAGLFTWMAASAAPSLVVLKQTANYQWLGYLAELVTRVLPLDALKALPLAVSFDGGATAAQWLELLTIPGWIVLAMLVFQRRSLS